MLFIKKVPQEEKEDMHIILKDLGFSRIINLRPGEIKCTGLSNKNIKLLQDVLTKYGYTIISNKKEILSEKIKMVIATMIDENKLPAVNISRFISEELGNNYTYLSDIFSEVNGLTIEHYIISYRINKAKYMMENTSLYIREIALLLHYKSVAHFSAQFKKVTSLTPSQYKDQIVRSSST